MGALVCNKLFYKKTFSKIETREYRYEKFSKVDIREEPEQQPTKEVEKIDYSEYEERLKKAKERI